MHSFTLTALVNIFYNESCTNLVIQNDKILLCGIQVILFCLKIFANEYFHLIWSI